MSEAGAKISSGMESSRPSLDFLLEMGEPESRSGSSAGSGRGENRLGCDDDDDDDDSQREDQTGGKDTDDGTDEQQPDDGRTASKTKKVREQNFIKSCQPVLRCAENRST